MRIGSLVSFSTIDPETHLWYIAKDAPQGTVIAIDMGCDRDGYDRIESVAVRWNDGRVETVAMDDEDRTLEDVTPETYANLYIWQIVEGGKEEGGWVYDTYDPVNGEWINDPPPYGHFPTVEAAEDAASILQDWCDKENKHRRHPSVSISEGYFVVHLEAWPAECKPQQKPHYC